MICQTIVGLAALALSVKATQLQSGNSAFFNAGIQGCISASDNANGAPAIIHDCNTEDVAHSDWKVEFFTREDSFPEPLVVFSDKCLDVTGGVNADGTKLQIWSCTGGPNQKWTNKKDGTFQWVETNKCIDLTDGKIGNGNQLQLWTCDSKSSNQQWHGAPNPDNRFTGQIESLNPPDNLGAQNCIAAESDTDGAKVAIINCASGVAPFYPHGNTTWTLPTPPLTGPIKIFNNKCLDVPSGSHTNGVKLQIWTCAEGNTNQIFHKNTELIEWSGQGKCLDLTDGLTTPGNPIQLWDCGPRNDNTNRNQIWL
ncbi:ricin B lectin domain-containing protein [Mycena rebaudengoi]|nr:ricin B lectin domain-containing protein [Mycena rebaudengoi]